jgi:hypothetical protein
MKPANVLLPHDLPSRKDLRAAQRTINSLIARAEALGMAA